MGNAAKTPAHTAGPWTINGIDGEAKIVATDDISVTSISVMTTALSHLQPSILGANARLVAAAPELKEKLLYALERLEKYDPDYYRSPFVAECDDLIKVIEGEA